jgi:hypothetical protein
MEKIGNEPLPIEEQNNMCPMIAAAVLNRKGYEIPIPRANCMMGVFNEFVNSALRRKGLQTVIYEASNLAVGKLRLVNKKNDGILLMRSRANPKIFHFIAFIVDSVQLRFYDAEEGKMDVYRLKNNASATDFDEDFIELFPDYTIVQVLLIQPIQGGKRKRKTRRKTRKHRR